MKLTKIFTFSLFFLVLLSSSQTGKADATTGNASSLAGGLDDPALTAVTREFGPTHYSLKAMPLPYTSTLAVTTTTPWSSWWYPKRESYLFDDASGADTSPLTKYDRYRNLLADAANAPHPASAADAERATYNPDSLSWEGLCDAWSLASLSKPEPKRAVTLKVGEQSVTFSVGDLKALLLMTYAAVEDTDLKFYGQKFTGDENGWVFPDIYPEQFHRLLEVQLFTNHLPLIMDHDPGVEVWNVPVYKANYKVESVIGDPDSIQVRTWLYSAESTESDQKDFVGTKQAIREYDYVLIGKRDPSGDLVIDNGYWIKGPSGIDSVSDHPDYITVIRDPDKTVRKSWNPQIDSKIVDQIVSGSY